MGFKMAGIVDGIGPSSQSGIHDDYIRIRQEMADERREVKPWRFSYSGKGEQL